MATALLTAPETDLLAGQRSLFETGGGQPTLDELIVGIWERLDADRPAACPVCAGAMRTVRRTPDGGAATLGRCESCGTAIR